MHPLLMVYIPAMKAQHLAVSATAVVAAMVQVAVVVEAAVEQVAVVVAAVVQVALVVEAWEMAAEGRRGRALLTPHLRHHPIMRRVGQAWICKPGNLWCPHQQMHRWPMTTTLNGHSKCTRELFHAARVNALQECHLARGRHTFYVVGQGSR